MSYIVLPFFMVSFLFSVESFITDLEYGELLYKNPRGIGCNLCHGEFGEGRNIASYISKEKKTSLYAPKINNMLYEKFKRAILKRDNKIMPTYHLIDEEIEAIYLYLEESRERTEEKE